MRILVFLLPKSWSSGTSWPLCCISASPHYLPITTTSWKPSIRKLCLRKSTSWLMVKSLIFLLRTSRKMIFHLHLPTTLRPNLPDLDCLKRLTEFTLLNSDKIRFVIINSRTKSCSLDSITTILKNALMFSSQSSWRSSTVHLRNGQCLACAHPIWDARG